MSGLLLRNSAIRALEAAHLPQASLMERAGLIAADYTCEILSQKVHTEGMMLVLAGTGNNGGDAYVCARHLLTRGHAVWLASLDPAASLPPDAAAARAAWLAAGGEIHDDFSADQLFDIAIDGLLGIGLASQRAISGRLQDWITRFNALPCPRLALDVPSGLNADTGEISGCAVQATHTITFLADKPGLHTLDGPDHAGRVRSNDLGISTDSAGERGYLVARAHFVSALVPRRHNTHKGSYGSVGIIGGSPGMAGAALLAGRAALHLGAGRVYVGMLEQLPVDYAQPELMLRNVPDVIAHADAIGIGPGLGTEQAALEALRLAIASGKPLAVDADALNLLAQYPQLADTLRHRAAATILTPHPAEAARLAATSTARIQQDRIASAQALARQFNAAVVIKGCGSVIALPDGRWFINGNGNPGLASGGSGDVLLGFITTLLAQQHSAETALLAAVHVHGAAADALLAQGVGAVGMTPSEIIVAARQCWNQWLSEC